MLDHLNPSPPCPHPPTQRRLCSWLLLYQFIHTYTPTDTSACPYWPMTGLRHSLSSRSASVSKACSVAVHRSRDRPTTTCMWGLGQVTPSGLNGYSMVSTLTSSAIHSRRQCVHRGWLCLVFAIMHWWSSHATRPWSLHFTICQTIIRSFNQSINQSRSLVQTHIV